MDKRVFIPKIRHSDEFYINLIQNNPNTSIEDLAKIAKVNRKTMANRIKKLKENEINIYKRKRPSPKVSDEILIELINNNPTLSMENIAKLTELSENSIWNRVKKINMEGQRVNYLKKKKLLSDEDIIELVNNNPNLNISELANLVGALTSTLHRRISRMNAKGKMVNYVKKSKYRNLSEASENSNLELTDQSQIKSIDDNLDESNKELMLPLQTITPIKIQQINADDQAFNHCDKGITKLSDEYIMDLVDNNPDLNMTELAKLAGTTNQTISRRINKLNSKGENVNYINKKGPKLDDESLINLIKQNPNLTMRELATIAETSPSSICLRVKKINNESGENISYRKKEASSFTDECLIDLINNNPNLSIRKLSKLTTISKTTIARRLKEINKYEERVHYRFRENQKVSDDFIIDLVHRNPSLNIEELSKLSNIAKSTISRRIRQINSDGVIRVNYISKLPQKAQKE